MRPSDEQRLRRDRINVSGDQPFPRYTPVDGSEAAVSADPGGPVVLVVDDEPQVRLIMARQLAAGGYRVLEAGSGEEALALLATVSIGVVVTDTCMPGGISGVELIRRIRATYPGPPILRISGVQASRFDDDPPPVDVPFLAKPFSMDELLARVQAALAHSAPSGA
ncbi:MAG: response regulator [Gemmatimonadales bacterium]